MAITFPSTPSTGDIFTSNGRSWQWDGTAWTGYGNLPDPSVFAVDATNDAVSVYGDLSVGASAQITGDLSVDTDTFHVDATNNRVGIGTATPTSALDIVGDINVTAGAGAASSRIDLIGGDARVYLEAESSIDGDLAKLWAYDNVTENFIPISVGASSVEISNVTVYSGLTVPSGDFTVDTNTLHVDSTNDRVGIGTTTPAYKLDVAGDIHISDSSPHLVFTDTDTNAESRISADSGQGSLRIEADYNNESANTNILFYSDGTEKMRIDSSGNVGIGTTSPAYALDVDGDINMRTGHSFYYDAAGVANPNPVFWIDGENTDIDIIRVGSDQFSTDSDYGMTLKYRGSGAGNDNAFDIEMDNQAGTQVTAMSILQNGNVGIGTTTPGARLEVAGSGLNATRIEGSVIGSVNDGYEINIVGGTPDSYTNAGGRIRLGGGARGDADIDSIIFMADTTERMRISSSGNVGIGTAAPATLLHVSSGTSGDAELRISADTDNNNEDDMPYLSFTADGSIIEGVVGLNNNTLVISNSVTSSAGIDLRTAGTNTYTTAADQVASTTSRLFINSSGNVGINDTTPSYRLDVNGPEDTASRVNISSGNTAYRYHMRFSRNNSLLANGIFSDTGATYFGNASDVNLKTGISDLSKQDALAAVSSLRPVEYRYLLDTEDVVRKGFIAQEMVEVIPEAVHRVGGGHPATRLIYDENGDLVATDVDENGDPIVQQEPDWMMTWEPITTTLVAAVQAQQELIQELTARIEELEAN